MEYVQRGQEKIEMTRFGFGDKTGESSKGGLAQYEDGHVEVSGKALKHAIENYPGEPPREAVGRMLGGESKNGLTVDWDDVRARLESVDGVGEAVADAIVEELKESFSDDENVVEAEA